MFTETTNANERPFPSMPEVKLPEIPERRFVITEYGAVGDGVTMNTDAIAAAIEACASAGGGKVIIPAGLWLTGPIRLKSRINLHAEKGALVVFSKNPEDYPLMRSHWEGRESVRATPPILGKGLEHVAITGEGVFDGSGDAWRPVKDWKMTEGQWKALVSSGGVVDPETNIWWPDEGAMKGASAVAALDANPAAKLDDYAPYRTFLRPVLVSLRECRYVLLEGPTFQNSPGWNLHPWACEHVTVRRVSVRNPWYSQNGDGLDLESCRYALIEDCVFDVGDDAICMKSGKDEEGRRFGKPVEYVTVRGCTVYHGHGGFVIGSEMSGGARNIIVEDCSFIGTDVGLRFKSMRGRGGVVENIVIRGIRMKDIAGAAISFNMYYGLEEEDSAPVPVTEETPSFRGIRMEDIYCIGAKQAVELKGLPEMPIRDIECRRMAIAADSGVQCTYGSDIRFSDVAIAPKAGASWTVQHSSGVVLSRCRGEGGAGRLLQEPDGTASRVVVED